MFFEECKYVVKEEKMPSDSDREDSVEENFNEGN